MRVAAAGWLFDTLDKTLDMAKVTAEVTHNHPEVPAVGNYITLTGKADRIDPVFRTLQVGDTVVPFEDLVEVSGEGIMDIDAYLGIGEE